MSEETTAPPGLDAAAARLAELEQKLTTLEASTRERLIQAELKTEAIRAGMIDLDGLKLADPSALTLDESGMVSGAASLLRDLRRAKPWLFGTGGSSSTAATPPAQPPRAKAATEMSHDEWQAARAELLRRR
jgi:hypothetical protein